MSQATRKPNSKKKHIYKIILLGSQGYWLSYKLEQANLN